MTLAETEYRRAWLRLQIATAQLLFQVSGPDRDVRLEDLIAFAAVVGDETGGADSVPAFHAQQAEKKRAAEAELKRLRRPDQTT